MQAIFDAEKYIFNLVNNRWNNTFFDAVLPFLRQANFWLPLYLFLLVFALLNVRKSGWFILLMVCTVALTDIISSHIIKPHIFRVRPCQDPNLIGLIRVLVNYCPQSSGFTSSHAANHFGMATFASITLLPYAGRWIYLSFAWAFAIVYAQLYVGVHYPFDIMGGALVGLITGWATASLYQKKWGIPAMNHQEA